MANRVYVVKATPGLIAIHKPAGVPFHSVDNEQGLLAAIRANPAFLTNTSDVATLPQQPRLFAVHRLDTGTSGIVCFATSAHVAGLVAKAFRERRVAKYYFALSARKPQRKQGSVTGDMARGRSSSWKLLRSSSDPAITRFQSYSLAAVQAGMRLYLLQPETGRTHQLRVAMKSNGAAILGDPLYGSAAAAGDQMKECCDDTKAEPGAVEPECSSLPARPAAAAAPAAPAAPPPTAAAVPQPAPAPYEEGVDNSCVKEETGDLSGPSNWDDFNL